MHPRHGVLCQPRLSKFSGSNPIVTPLYRYKAGILLSVDHLTAVLKLYYYYFVSSFSSALSSRIWETSTNTSCPKCCFMFLQRCRKKPLDSSPRHELHDKFVCICDLAFHLLPNFVILPKSRKTRMARLATYSTHLQHDLMLCGSLLAPATQDICSLDEIVTQSGLVNPDHMGWLMDQSCGEKRWAVVADMLFCLFASNYSEQPLCVMVLPGHEIRSLLFKSAKRDSIEESCRTQMFNRTISGLLRHQFMLRNPSTQKEYIFALEDIAERDNWVAMLRVAANLDTDIFTASDSESDAEAQDSLRPTPLAAPQAAVNPNDSQTTGRQKCRRSMSLNIHAITDTPAPRYVPGGQSMSEPRWKKHTSNNSNNDINSGPMFIRRQSCRDLSKLQKDQQFKPTKSLNNTTHSSRKKSLSLFKMGRNLSKSDQDSPSQPRQHLSSYSVPSIFKHSDSEKPAFNKLAKKVSSFKLKLKQKGAAAPEPTLGALHDFLMSGFLKVKQKKKWVRMWCVIAPRRLYAFKSKNLHELPELSWPLHQCMYQATKDDSCVFKLCHLNAHSTFFAAEDRLDFSQWMMVLKAESSLNEELASPPSGSDKSSDSGSSTMSIHDDSRNLSSDFLSSPSSEPPKKEPETLSDQNSNVQITHSLKQDLAHADRIKAPQRSLFVTLNEHKQHIAAIAETKRKLSRNDSCESIFSERSHGSTESGASALSAHSGMSQASDSSQMSSCDLRDSQLHMCKLRCRESSLTSEESITGVNECRSEPNSPCSHNCNQSVGSKCSLGAFHCLSPYQRSRSSFDSTDNTTDDSELEADLESHEACLLMKSLPSFPKANNLCFPTRYDQNVRQVWKVCIFFSKESFLLFKARFELMFILKVDHVRQFLNLKISTLPDRPAIFSRHLPGPNNEGVLWVNDPADLNQAAIATPDDKKHKKEVSPFFRSL